MGVVGAGRGAPAHPQLDFRAAVAIQPAGAKGETFGTFFATARTQVDRVARTVVLENLAIYRSDFPLLPDRGKAYAPELAVRVGHQGEGAPGAREIELRGGRSAQLSPRP